MTAMTDEKRVSDDKLREIIAGTKDVTPGPWYWDEGGLRTEWSEAEHIIWPANAVPASGLVSENLGALGEHSETNAVLNAAHIARLDPQTVTAICSELLARRSQEPDGWRLAPVDPTEKITAYEAQVLIGTSISGCNMPPDRVFDLKAAWARLYDFGLIDRADGIACPTQAGTELIASMLAPRSTPAQAGEATLASLPQQTAEPVAWRIRERPGFPWEFTDYDPRRMPNVRDWEAEPLYTRPASPPVGGALNGINPKLVKYVEMLRAECAYKGPCSDNGDGCTCSVEELDERHMRALRGSAMASSERSGREAAIYIASKTKHAARWRALRDSGVPINSTWIDEAGEGESQDLQDLWRRCLSEASNASAIIVYREPNDVLKGAWIELGAAASHGVPVFAVGIEEFTIARHKGIRHFDNFDDALAAAIRNLAGTKTNG